MAHLFLTYAHADRDIVFPFHAALETTGHYIWIDKEELVGGAQWEAGIKLAIDTSYGVICAVTVAFFNSTFIRDKEIPWILERFKDELARNERCIFPVLMESAAKPTLENHVALSRFQYIDATHGDIERTVRELTPLLPAPVAGQHQFIVSWPRLPTFKGRGEALQDLHRRLAPGNAKMGTHASLYGMGGVGKTQLAVEYAHRYRFHYPGGVYWINGAVDWKQEIMNIADRLRLSPADPHTSDRSSQMVAAFNAFLRDQNEEALVIVDNVGNPPDVTNYEIGPKLTLVDLPARLLITTRMMIPLHNFIAVSVTTMENEPIAARAILKDARPNETDTDRLDEICRVLGYLPLALGLASAALRKRPILTIERFREYLKTKGIDDIALAVNIGPPDLNVPSYYNFAVEIALDWHWEKLQNKAACDIIALAASFGEAASIPLARLCLLANITEDNESLEQPFDDAVSELGISNMVEDVGENSLRLHPLVREYVRKKVSDYPARFAKAAECLVNAYRVPEILHNISLERSYGSVIADLRETRLALENLSSTSDPTSREKVVSAVLISLEQIEQLLNWEAHHIVDWNSGEFPALLIQQVRERAHHQDDDLLRKDCDKWLQTYFHLCSEDFWRLPHDPALVRIFEGHNLWISSIALNAELRLALSGSADKSLRLWDITNGTQLRIFNGHEGSVYAVALSKDGKQAISASQDGTIRLWDTATGDERRCLKNQAGWIYGMSLSPDWRQVLFGAIDGVMRLWDISAGIELQQFKGHSSWIYAVALSADGRLAVSGGRDGTVRVWDVESSQELNCWQVDGPVNAVAISGDGRIVLSGGDDNTVRVWSADTDKELLCFRRHSGPVYSVFLSVDGRLALSGAADNQVRLWDVVTGAELRRFVGHTDWLGAVTLSNDGQLALTGSDDKTLRLWNVAAATKLSRLQGHGNWIHSVAISRDGQLAVSGGEDKTIRLWDLTTGTELRCFHGHAGAVLAVSLSSDGKLALSGSSDRTVRLWNTTTGAELYRTQLDGSVYATALGGDGLFLFGSHDCTVQVTNEREVRGLYGHTKPIYAISISTDERVILSAAGDRTLRLWDVETGTELRRFIGHTRSVYTATLSVNGNLALSGGADRTLRLWDVETGTELRRFIGHQGAVLGAAISMDENFIISGATDHTLRLWDVENGKLLAKLRLDAIPRAVALVPGNKFRVFVGDKVGDVRVIQVKAPSMFKGNE